ncbi:glycosyltransferase [Arthrobacter humicola]
MLDNRRDPSAARELRVLYSFGPTAHDANPYVNLLLDAVARKASIHYFSWKFALLGSYDVFHVHWPETLVRRRTLPGRLACTIGLALLLVRLAFRRIPIVRTEHNLRPHETGTKIEAALLRILDAQAAVWIVMNQAASRHSSAKLNYIPHGHYRDWYSSPKNAMKIPGKILNFGLIRPYKGVESLIAAFKDLPKAAKMTLSIMGKPQSQESVAELHRLIGGDASITADLRHIPDEELAASIAESEMVVLPYRAMHNSGALLLALSLGTPVLVPKNEVTDALAAEVGANWVQRFEGSITPAKLLSASNALMGLEGSPDLSLRDWSRLGNEHVKAYQRAIQIKRPEAHSRRRPDAS